MHRRPTVAYATEDAQETNGPMLQKMHRKPTVAYATEDAQANAMLRRCTANTTSSYATEDAQETNGRLCYRRCTG